MFGAFFRRRPARKGTTLPQIPLADIQGTTPGKTLLVTAGMDGDEYVGIEAAYALMEKYAAGNFAGRLIIIPIVNMAGFTAECSINPLDNKFPKYTFPGKGDGTPTEQLMFWIVTTYASTADCWVDLHGGSLTESVTPFVWLYTTGNPLVDEQVNLWVAKGATDTVVVEEVVKGSQAGTLAQKGCMYVLTEAGGRGNREPTLISQQVAWVESLMQQFQMLPLTMQTPRTVTVYRHVQEVSAPTDGVFTPCPEKKEVQKGDILGTCRQYDGKMSGAILAPKSGTILWRKETPAMRKGDTLAAIAY